ncbi:MAG TPA: extracellular solute-binding protein [Candidatus Gracilibacteria bacterium]|nr:extracellular solute-binding protein [Candidatus Gracilibacteria bacterium]
MNLQRFIAVLTLGVMSTTLLSGCISRPQGQVEETNDEKIELVYYKLFDGEDVIRPLIQQYQSEHPNVSITYRKFEDPQEYENLIINELAEGEGPDIFSMPNHWFLRNTKKISPLPSDMATPEQFEATFVNVATNDLVLRDPRDGQTRIFGIPLTVDTLALYYNKAQFEDKLPSRGRPATTWAELQEDVFQLSKTDNSFERFELAGIAMGRSDNISRWMDILFMLMLQYGTELYNDNVSGAEFARQRIVTETGQSINPAEKALELYTSFALPANKNYSWNSFLASAQSAEKELDTFARGKVSMVFGYSFMYEQIMDKIQELDSTGVNTIDPSDVRIAMVPQVYDPETSTEKRDALASYYAETVSRTSPNARAAWEFLLFMSRKDNLEYYNDETHRPTSRRDMIEDQKLDPIYGVYAEQIGFAESFPIYDANAYANIFSKAVDSVLATGSVADAIRTAETEMNDLLPSGGLIPPPAEEESSA